MVEFVYIVVALALGLAARLVKLPALVGFLAAGFVLRGMGYQSDAALKEIADLGVTLLLFSIGLKLKIRTLLRPSVWAVATLHMAATVAIFGAASFGLGRWGLPFFGGLDLPAALLLAFALSFSSTVFAVKVLEEKGETASLHARTAIGILIMQDLFAVVFMGVSTGKVPSLTAVAAVAALIVFRRALIWVMERCGHGELLVLFGVLVALGGSQAFDAVGVKADLGALFLGVLLAGSAKADELSKTLLGFKDLFLVGFFLNIGLSREPDPELLGVALLLAAAMPLKTVLFFALLSRFKLWARSALFTSLTLANYSEFGLIVAGVAAAGGWLPADWMLIIAVALSITFVAASALNAAAPRLYERWSAGLARFERPERLPEEQPADCSGARVLVCGMGRVGAGAYDFAEKRLGGGAVVGIDSDPAQVKAQQEAGRRVVLGDATDPDFWERIKGADQVQYVLLAMPSHGANRRAGEEIRRRAGEAMRIGAAARFADEWADLQKAGVQVVLDFYREAGAGLAERVLEQGEPSPGAEK